MGQASKVVALAAGSNNGMHPTRSSAALKLNLAGGRVMPGVRLPRVSMAQADMKKYKVFVRGENFLINLDGVNQKAGFYTTRFVEAGSEKQAEHAVMDMLRSYPGLVQVVSNEESDPPMMFAEEIEELESFKGFAVPGAGFSFYPEGGGE